MSALTIVPITLADAKAFVEAHHRHHKPPVGHKFSIGLRQDQDLVGCVIVGRPVSRHLDDGFTAEVTRSCVLEGIPNANSMLYGAAWRAARAMGFTRGVTYTQDGESGASLRAAGWVPDAELAARKSWAESSVQLQHIRGRGRLRWSSTHSLAGGGMSTCTHEPAQRTYTAARMELRRVVDTSGGLLDRVRRHDRRIQKCPTCSGHYIDVTRHP